MMPITQEILESKINHQLRACFTMLTNENRMRKFPLLAAQAVWKTIAVSLHTAAVHEVAIHFGSSFGIAFKASGPQRAWLNTIDYDERYFPRQDASQSREIIFAHRVVEDKLEIAIREWFWRVRYINDATMRYDDFNLPKFCLKITHDSLCRLLLKNRRLDFLGIMTVALDSDGSVFVADIAPEFFSYIGPKKHGETTGNGS